MLKKTLIITIILLSAGLTLQSQTKDTVYVVKKDTVYMAKSEPKFKPVEYELGLLIGNAGRYNIAAIAHSDNFLWKLSGGYFSYPAGAQAEVGYKIDEIDRTYYGVSAGVGIYAVDPIFKEFGVDILREYFSIKFFVSSYGVYFSPGFSVDFDDLYFPQLIYQIGYAYQFR